jgi:hypothetical protein
MDRSIQKPIPRLVAEWHAQLTPPNSVIRIFRTTAAAGKPSETDSILANPPSDGSVSDLRACAFRRKEANIEVVRATRVDNLRQTRILRHLWDSPNHSFAQRDCAEIEAYRPGDKGAETCGHAPEPEPAIAA